MASQIVRIDALRSVANGSITTSYTPLGTAFAHPMRLVHLLNDTDGNLLFSFNGTTDNIFVPAKSFLLLDCTTNREESITYFVFAVGTQFLVKYSTAPTTGSVHLMAMYGQGE